MLGACSAFKGWRPLLDAARRIYMNNFNSSCWQQVKFLGFLETSKCYARVLAEEGFRG